MAELYAIASSMPRARLYLEAGVPWLQLRFKEAPLSTLELAEVRTWAERYPQTRVIINDDLRLAEAAKVWGAHLGQEDLARWGAEALAHTPVHVGLSTHCAEEIERALELGVAMIGFGPIFATTTKEVAHAPQGTEALHRVVHEVQEAQGLPVVAIGGIDAPRMCAVADTGVACVAMIGALERIASVEALRALMRDLHSAGHEAGMNSARGTVL